jgi:antimicrobial peptide system SdpB family protein
MLTRFGAWARRWAADASPWTNVYGVARTILALGTLTTLVFTRANRLILPAAGLDHPLVCAGPTRIGMFCLAGEHHLELARYVAIGCLLLVASGWRPRVMALLHWWVAFTVQDNIIVADGGDQATLVLVTLLLPIALTDPRRWHWQPAPVVPAALSAGEERRRLLALVAMILVRVQVAMIYFHAATGKFSVEEWGDGTALWYFANDSMLGASHPVAAVVVPLLRNGVVVTVATWGVLVLESMLAVGLFLDRRYRGTLLALGVALHAGIILLFGLVSFALAMFGALILFLRPFDMPFALRRSRRRSGLAGPTDAVPLDLLDEGPARHAELACRLLLVARAPEEGLQDARPLVVARQR